MKIKKLEIVGFKSFVDRTVVHFEHDVTGIVGPNGCGKSNIVDAIRWCMGEQSAKHLRGKSMEDVIFNGSENRGPHGFAEVTITFDNTAGAGPAEYRDYAEIAVTRRLDRQGDSDYLINKTPVRLLDITELFLGTGVGTKAYSIIEQGRVGFIVSSKPEERRHLIEEAAGITKFKAKKKAAERKMEQTRANLLRVNDITAEIERSLSSLQRQAQKADRYKKYRGEMRDLELYVASHKYLENVVVDRVVRSELETESARVEGVRLALRLREAETEGERLALYELESVVDAAQNRAYTLDNVVKQLEGEITRAKDRIASLEKREASAESEAQELLTQSENLSEERRVLSAQLAEHEELLAREAGELERENAELDRRRVAAVEAEQALSRERSRVGDAKQRIARAEAVLGSFERRREEARIRLSRLENEAADLETRRVRLSEEIEAHKARLEAIRSGKTQSVEQKQSLEKELEGLRVEVKDSEKRVDVVRNQLAEKRSRLRSLEEIQKRFEGVGGGVRAVMQKFAQQPGDSGVIGLLADRIDVAAEWTHALAGALGERLQDVVVRDAASAAKCVQFLSEGNKGRAAFVPQHPSRVIAARADLSGTEGVHGWLSDLVRFADEDEALVRQALDGVLVVESLDVARTLSATLRTTFVTKRGELFGEGGRVVGGRGEEVGAHMLDVKREIRELHSVVTKLDAEMNEAVTTHGELRKRISHGQAELDAARNAAHENEIALVKADRDVARAGDDFQRTTSRTEQVARDIEELGKHLAAAGEEEDAAKSDIEAARSVLREADEALLGAEAIHRERRASVESQNSVVTEIRVRAAQAKQLVESGRSTTSRLERSVTELGFRVERLRAEIAEGSAQQGTLAAQVMLQREALLERSDESRVAHTELSSAKEQFEAARGGLSEQEGAMRELRQVIEKKDKRVTELTLRARELAIEVEHLLGQVTERHRLDLRRILTDYHSREVPGPEVKARVEELGRLIERMGEVNLMAVEEYEEQSKRFEYYSSQKKDLDDALSQLDKAIRKMNIESKKLFRETFHEVNARFKRVFPTMFGGGQAELRLTNPDDMLESGVEIVAQPPGKRLGSIELMSGGEKALTAVSLIFAIFSFKPSPFCILDEVDAPLDEANIGRFADAVRQMTDHSQFILITHSKRTMETADMLYGVTMEMPGVSKLVSVELRKNEAKKAKPPVEQVAVA